MTKQYVLKISEEVSSALQRHLPVVALESTVIAHGLPRPVNIETATSLEAIAREECAIPATIAILGGEFRVGLDAREIEFIGSNPEVKKVSIRDLPIAVAMGWNGATTVASTLWVASRAGLKVFATGGIGGIHRGGLRDISADLPELARTPMTVVCSGAKIVLDLDNTREWLETHGVTVIGFGCDRMPAFYSRESHLPVDARVENVEQVADIALARDAIGHDGATLLTVPIPADAEIDAGRLQNILANALAKAEADGIVGRELTPFLLSNMAMTSEGDTLRANIALLKNNARIAARVAKAIAARR
jgi:pseudouridine-5'-phosphate glycosidase